MADNGYKRKLTAILGADVKGYSRLMGDDEEATLQTLTAHRQLFTSMIEQYRGRVVSTPGDYILAEFVSVVDAVKCAIDVQQELAKQNAKLPDDRKMEFRIGINLGDVIEEDGQIYGDGVNIAARMEPLAEPGGICISGRAYDQVANKIGLEYEYLGEHEVKNISTPIGVYQIISLSEDGADRVVAAPKTSRRKWRNIALLSGFLVLLVIVVFVGRYIYKPQAVVVASEENMAYPLPDEPSIAVLPLDAIGGADDEELLAEGLSSSIITALSKTPKLFVVDYNSTSGYKGKEVPIKTVAEDLGVQYVLQGDLQKSGGQVRINVQLIDALTGEHLWAEKYDRTIEDLFAMQDDITMEVIKALQVELYEGEYGNILVRGTDNLAAYLKIIQGYQQWQVGNKEGDAIAQRLAEEAIALDPNYAAAYSLLSRTQWREVAFRIAEDPKKKMQESLDNALKAVSLDYSADTLSQLGWVYTRMRKYDKGIKTAKRGLKLNPNNSRAYSNLGLTLIMAGRCEDATKVYDKALRISPIPSANILFSAATAYRDCHHYDECIALSRKAIELAPDSLFAHTVLTSCYALSGQIEEAQATAEEVLRINPNFKVRDPSKSLYLSKEISERNYNAHIMAGLPGK